MRVEIILAAAFLLSTGAHAQQAQDKKDPAATMVAAEEDAVQVPPDITVQRTPVPTLLGDTTGVRLEGYESGTVYADAKGHTLYVNDRDAGGKPFICNGACARTWRAAWAPGTAVAAGDWSVIASADDGTRQWAYKGRPVYTYVGDNNPGDANGDGVDGVWRSVVERKPFRPAEVTLKTVDGRPVLADAKGFTLYTFDGDENLGPTYTLDHALPERQNGVLPKLVGHCINACAETWRALIAPPDAKAPPKGDWTLVERVDDPSKKQWAFRRYPLYTYAGDKTPADANGVNIKYGPDYAFSVMFRIATTETGRF